MKNKKIITCLLILVTFCIGISNVGATPYNTSNSSAKTCMNYKKKTSCNNNVSCKWVDNVCRVKTCTNLTDSDTCSKNTDKNKKQCYWNGIKCSNQKNTAKIVDTTSKNSGSLKGCNVFGPKTSGLLKWAIHLIQIAAPLLVVALGITDFLKILLSGEEKEYKESGKKFIKRLLALVALELLPYVLFFIIDISGVASQYGIERGEIYCVLEF